MDALPTNPAAIAQPTPQELALSGSWTARGLGDIAAQLETLSAPSEMLVDGAGIEALDSAGAWVLQKLLRRLGGERAALPISGLRPEFAKLLAAVGQHGDDQTDPPIAIAPTSRLEDLGRSTEGAFKEALALLSFVGECALALARCVAHPTRLRWRPIFYNIRSAGFDALPIVGVLSFLLGVVVAYQGADQLRQYGANIFVADLVGLSMLREFAPLITAIIIAGRSGSAYAAQIGTMSVT
jgi:phospholipid/cholesterol/gamma-HCH transport system permease protein